MKKWLAMLLALCMLLCAAAALGDETEEKKVPYCGNPEHWVGDGLEHYRPEICWTTGHFECDGLVHERAACKVHRHYTCDGRDHSAGACGVEGHFVCDGKDHAVPECGNPVHCTSDGKNHSAAACGIEGHFQCAGGYHYAQPISKYCDASPQHMPCEGNPEHYCDPTYGGCGDTYTCSHSNAHTPCRMCGLLWCDRTLGGHETPCNNANHRPCVYTMKGMKYVKAEHDDCGYCGGSKCDGEEHGNGKCVQPCPSCGYPLKFDGSHYAACGMHYACQAGSHTPCACGENYKCNTNHTCKTAQE